MKYTIAENPSTTEGVFAVGHIPPASELKPLDINDVLALLVGERKQNRALIQRLYDLTAMLRECDQFLGDLQTDDVDRPKWAAEALGHKIGKLLEDER